MYNAILLFKSVLVKAAYKTDYIMYYGYKYVFFIKTPRRQEKLNKNVENNGELCYLLYYVYLTMSKG